MRTARRLFAAPFVPCLLALALLATPVLAQVEVRAVHDPEEDLVPMPTAITDDPGPFDKIDWDATSRTGSGYVEVGAPGRTTSVVGPALLLNPFSGRALTVWVREATATGDQDASAGGDLLLSQFDVGGWTRPVLLAEGAADPVVVIDPADGGVHVVYWTPGDGGVWQRQAPADLTGWSEPVRVSDAREAAARPAALAHGGRLVIAYESHLAGLGSAQRALVVATPRDGGFARTVVAYADFAGRNWLRLDADGPRLMLRWVADAHRAGSALSEREGLWGAAHLQPLRASLPVDASRESTARSRR